MAAAILLPLLWALRCSAQQAGDVAEEAHPSLTVKHCASGIGSGAPCRDEDLEVTLDAQYRWVHDADGYDNCFDAGSWDKKLCSTGAKCAKRCAIDGVDEEGYSKTYGVSETRGGLNLNFAVKGQYGTNYGSRVYVLDGEDKYKMFKLKNREFTFDVDLSNLPCGLNGAAYFVAMDEKGEYGKGYNDAGAKYGLGYCDAQCPRGQKFVQGEANLEGWTSATNEGHMGSCCAELDLFEANRNASAMTVHPCSSAEPSQCDGDECDDKDICDKDGCQYNPYHMGNPWFYGPGKGFTVDTTKPFTVVTQFITDDGTDYGDLSEIRRFYRQGGKTFEQPGVAGPAKTKHHIKGSTLNDEYCEAKDKARKHPDKLYKKGKGYLKKMGDAMDRGMVLILSVWDDPATNMAWLDASNMVGQSESGQANTWNGPCFHDSQNVRVASANAMVSFSNFAYGELFSTCSGCEDASTPRAPKATRPPRTSSTSEEPIIVPEEPTELPTLPPWARAQESSTTTVAALPPVVQNPLFIPALITTGVIAAVILGWVMLKAHGWEIDLNRALGGGASTRRGAAPPTPRRSAVRPRE